MEWLDENVVINMILKLWGMICSKLGILAFIYVLVLFVVLLDMWSGIRKAKQRKEYTSSYGMRRTFDKLAKYYNVLLALTVADLLQMGFCMHYNIENEASVPILPFVTALGAFLVCIVEIKSICESADKKMKGQYQEAAKQLSQVLKHKDGVNIIAALLSEFSKEEDAKEGKDG